MYNKGLDEMKGTRREKTQILYANNKMTNMPAYEHKLISAFTLFKAY